MTLPHLTIFSPLRVALIEDEQDLREEIVFSLNQLGFNATGYSQGAAFYAAMGGQEIDIVLIDVGLPGEDGFSILARLRASSEIGVIMLTARGALEDRIRGLQQGADVYLVKPVPLQELVATIQALGRRLRVTPGRRGVPDRRANDAETVQNASSNSPRVELQQNGWILQCGVQGGRLVLSAPERAILQLLFSRKGEEVSRDELIEALAGNDNEEFDPHRVDVLVSRLRQKIRATGIPLVLKAVRSVGYVLVI